jgi:hypothetical protein
MQKLDGNVAAGILRDVFAFEMTTAEGTCDHCGAQHQVGELSVYMHGMGMVVRCPDCATMLMRIARIQDQYWLDMRGISVLRIKSAQ